MDATALSNQIERILRSQTFARKSQLRKLLEVLVKNIDSQSMLSPDLVIRELWPEEIRTKRSTDVATEMNRLRHALQSYYATEGASDALTIRLPNRAVGANGTQERPWIVATPRGAEQERAAGDHSPDLQVDRSRANPRARLRKMVAIAALVVALAILTYVAMRMAHDPPQSARLDGTILRVMDASGKELWNKSFPDGFTNDWYFGKGIETHIWFGDLEGKGQTSVLFLYSPANIQSHTSALICYSDRGKEKWRWTPGRDLPELNGSPATFRTAALGVLKATDKRPPRIVVASIHDTWWPSQIALLDGTGKTISEYWHSGALTYMILADLDGDGREEIIATGVSEYDHQATLVVLDPDHVSGASTEERPEFQIHGMGVAHERMRLLFPRSDLNRALFQFNWATDPIVEHGSLRLTVTECITPPGCRIWYEFDKSFHLIAAFAGSDEFRSAHARFYENRKDAHPLSAEEQAAFQKVRCLVGCKTELFPSASWCRKFAQLRVAFGNTLTSATISYRFHIIFAPPPLTGIRVCCKHHPSPTSNEGRKWKSSNLDA